MLHKYFGELLPALEIAPDNTEQLEVRKEVTVPEIRGLSIKDAVKILKEAGLDANVNAEKEIDRNETIIKDQVPKPGLTIYSGTKVELYVNMDAID